MAAAPPFHPFASMRRAARDGVTFTLARLIVLISLPAGAATVAIGAAAGEPLVIASGACGLLAPTIGSVQLGLRRPHPSVLMVLWAASVLLLAFGPAPVLAEASGLGLAAVGTAIILLHAPPRTPLYLALLSAAAGALLLVTHGVAVASAVAAVILSATVWGSMLLHSSVARRLRQSEARFRGAFEDAPIAMVLADDSGIRRVNPAFEAMLGYREENVRGRSLESITLADDRPSPGQAVPDGPAAGDQPATPFEHRYRRSDGTVMWGQTAVTTLRDAFADQAHQVVQILDVTRRRAALEVILRAEERQRSLLSCMPVALWQEDFSAVGDWLESLRRTGVQDLREYLSLHPGELTRGTGLIRVIDVNDAAVGLVKAHRKEDLLGGIPQVTFTAETRDSFIAQFLAVWEGRTAASVEVVGATVDGQRIECELQWAAPVVAGKRDLRRVVVAITDLTERNQTRAELQRRVALENLIAELSTDFINLRPEETDEGIERALQVIGRHAGAGRSYLFRFSPDGALMSNTHEWCAPEVAPMKQRIQDVPVDGYPWVCEQLKAGRAVVVRRVADLPAEAAAERAEFEVQGITSLILVPMVRAGSVMGFIGFDSLAAGHAWAEGDVRLLGLVGEMFVNTLERKVADERLAMLMRSKDELIAAVSHELRTPLTAVLGLAEELRTADDLPAEERCELLGFIVEQSRDLSHLVEDLLVASRVDTGQLRVAAEQISLREQVEQTLRGLRPPAGSSIEPPDSDASAWADALRVRQILRNLLTNAFRYGGTRIRIRLEPRESSAALLVHDDGPGVPEPEQRRMFEPVGTQEAPGRPGSLGLGLPLSRRLARLMGGDLRYRATSGSLFELVVPTRTPLLLLPIESDVDAADAPIGDLPCEVALTMPGQTAAGV
ncbi:MAG TPA: PAS domain S-box protein [Acidimicrobiia bacterium]|nr:PAS domain S-box protein [Acidimicrobiia bacterium]